MMSSETVKYITFVVPSYNSAAYLNRCIDSLLIGGDSIEIIIVDDGSTDDTAVIADSYSERFPDIVRVIHKANGGHGSCVNSGIEAGCISRSLTAMTGLILKDIIRFLIF